LNSQNSGRIFISNNDDMTKAPNEILLNCFMIEYAVKEAVMRGMTSTKELVAKIDEIYEPETQFEMEMYSEAIVYARSAMLN
jgi:hypothetical protein